MRRQAYAGRFRQAAGVSALLLLVVFCLGCGSWDDLWSFGKTTPYEGNLRELFTTIRQRSLNLRSCQLEFEVTVTEGETTRVRRGTAWVHGLAVRLEEEITFEPRGGVSHEVRVTDGRESWTYRADDGVATVQPLSPETQEELANRVARYGPLALVVDVPRPGPNLQVHEVRTRQGKQSASRRSRAPSAVHSPGSGEPSGWTPVTSGSGE